MRNTASICIGLAGIALVLASIVPAVSDAAAGRGWPQGADSAPASGSGIARKGDMLGAYRPMARSEVVVSGIEGGPERSIWMRTRSGQIAYQASETAALTSAAKNVVLPRMPERMATTPTAPATRSAAAPASLGRGALPVGCERMVSVLVRSPDRDRIGRCIS